MEYGPGGIRHFGRIVLEDSGTKFWREIEALIARRDASWPPCRLRILATVHSLSR